MTTPFTMTVDYEKHLALGVRQVDVLLTVTASSQSAEQAAPPALVLIIDCSDSMRFPVSKLAAAARAAAAAIELLPDGVPFAVVKGTSTASMIYPAEPTLVPASAATRESAGQALDRLQARGGTAMGSWLMLTKSLFDDHPGRTGHAILLTDGRNESESTAELESALSACEGHFVCDASAIGEAWDPGQLRRIVAVLRGSAQAIVDHGELPEHFRRLTRASLAKTVSDMHIRIQTMPFCNVQTLLQTYPQLYDLHDRLVEVEPNIHELTTGSWGPGDRRSYYLRFVLDSVPAKFYGVDRQAAVLRLEPTDAAAVAILSHATDAPAPTTKVDSIAGGYSALSELLTAIDAGGAAYNSGRTEAAEREWGRAVTLATRLGDGETLRRLDGVVEVIDAGAGTARLRPGAARSAVLELLTGAPVRPILISHPDDTATVDCARSDCDGKSPAGAAFCVKCGAPIDASGS